MAKTITKENELMGLTKQQIISKLGLPKKELKNENVDYMIYFTDKFYWRLKINFKNDTANEISLFQAGLHL